MTDKFNLSDNVIDGKVSVEGIREFIERVKDKVEREILLSKIPHMISNKTSKSIVDYIDEVAGEELVK
jgi:hypothetical protein